MTQKAHSSKHILIRIAIILAACALLAGALRLIWVIRCNVLFEGWVLSGYGFEEGIFPQKITAADMAVVDAVLGDNGISYKLNEEGNLVVVRNYEEEKAKVLLKNCGYEFDGYIVE